MTRLLPLFVLVLAGCGAAPPLPPPSASGTVVLNIWDPATPAPTVLIADRIAQVGQHFEQFALTAVRGRLIQSGLDVGVNSPSGVWSTSTGILTLDGPVHLAGTWQGRPVLGTASSARLVRADGSISLDNLELWHQGSRTTAPLAVLHRDHSMDFPRDVQTTPLDPGLQAAFSALPDPLPLPK